ncbi:hypothetical protein ONE63_009197 [Megalurothrips usitatus]|uniref:Uncharacterized protein n=1 Tax=Megalurothrips usitatus TaxID=439358 RepID=A0AAV7XNM3_9NEOP|nr:hypothetical protein ONE63_009197 [Megalurothrips usitatus]
MFSSQDSSSQGAYGDGISDLPVVAMATGDGRGTVRGTLCGVRPHPHPHLHPHASLFGTVRGERCLGGTLRSAHGGTLRSVQGTPRCALTNLHGTVRAPRGGPRVSHFLPGSNEFTAPHRSSSMLLLPGQESISYM